MEKVDELIEREGLSRNKSNNQLYVPTQPQNPSEVCIICGKELNEDWVYLDMKGEAAVTFAV
ncbi:MAG: hypothetical protein QXL06_02080 [Nitrososphaerota archaeon]